MAKANPVGQPAETQNPAPETTETAPETQAAAPKATPKAGAKGKNTKLASGTVRTDY